MIVISSWSLGVFWKSMKPSCVCMCIHLSVHVPQAVAFGEGGTEKRESYLRWILGLLSMILVHMNVLTTSTGQLCDSKNYVAVTKLISVERLNQRHKYELRYSPWSLMWHLRPSNSFCLPGKLSNPLPFPMSGWLISLQNCYYMAQASVASKSATKEIILTASLKFCSSSNWLVINQQHLRTGVKCSDVHQTGRIFDQLKTFPCGIDSSWRQLNMKIHLQNMLIGVVCTHAKTRFSYFYNRG